VVTHQLQVERRTGKVRQSETDVLPLCHAANEFNIYQTEITLPFDHFFATKRRLFLAMMSETGSQSDFRSEVETLLLKSMLVVLK